MVRNIEVNRAADARKYLCYEGNFFNSTQYIREITGVKVSRRNSHTKVLRTEKKNCKCRMQCIKKMGWGVSGLSKMAEFLSVVL